jgi:VWFA-related protein
LFTNRAELSPGPPRNITALVLDTLNTPPAQQVWVRSQAMRYLRTMPPSTRLAIYGLGSGMTIWHDFTDDTDSLRARIEKIATLLPQQQETDIQRMTAEAEQLLESLPPEMRESMQQILETQIRNDMEANRLAGERRLGITLGHLESLGNHLAGIPGRKNLVWISGGISTLAITGAMGFGPGGGIHSYEPKIQQTARRLASQGVTMYLVDARGLYTQPEFDATVTALPRVGGPFARQRQAAAITADPNPAMDLMASVTGGRVLRNSNDMAQGIKKAAADLLGSYTLGFYSVTEPDDKWHKLDVKVKRRGVRLTHAQGYLAEAATDQAPDWSPEQWTAATRNPIGSTALRLDARCEPAAGRPAGTVNLLLQIGADGLHFQRHENQVRAVVAILIAQKSSNGEITANRDAINVDWPAEKLDVIGNLGVRYTRQLKRSPSASTIRVLVRDQRSGRYGTLDLPVNRIPETAAESR